MLIEAARSALLVVDVQRRVAPAMHRRVACLERCRVLIAEAVARGGGVRVGLEDAPFGSEMTNLRWVEQAATAVAGAGGQIATRAEVRRRLARGAG